MVAMAVFHRHADALRKADRINQMEAVGGLVARLATLEDRRPAHRECCLLVLPRLAEVVLRTSAVQGRRPRLPIYEDHVVTLAPPRSLEVGDRDVAPDVMSLSLGFEDHVVGPALGLKVRYVGLGRVDDHARIPRRRWVDPSPLGMEVGRLGGKVLPVEFVVDIKVLSVWHIVLVGDLDARMPVEGHRQVTVEGRATAELVRLFRTHRRREGQ